MTRDHHDAGKRLATFVETLNAFEVKVVCRLVKDNEIWILQHHAADHAAYFFAPAQHIGFFHDVVAAKQHFTEKTAQKRFISVCYMGGNLLAKPVEQRKSFAKKFVVFYRQISFGNGGSPFVFPAVRLQLPLRISKKLVTAS